MLSTENLGCYRPAKICDEVSDVCEIAVCTAHTTRPAALRHRREPARWLLKKLCAEEARFVAGGAGCYPHVAPRQLLALDGGRRGSRSHLAPRVWRGGTHGRPRAVRIRCGRSAPLLRGAGAPPLRALGPVSLWGRFGAPPRLAHGAGGGQRHHLGGGARIAAL